MKLKKYLIVNLVRKKININLTELLTSLKNFVYL